MSYTLPPGGSPTATIKIAAQAADVPEGQTGWIVLADAILPGYVPPAGRAVALFGDEGGYTQAVVSTTATVLENTSAQEYSAYFETPFATAGGAELVDVVPGSSAGGAIAGFSVTITDTAAARLTRGLGMGGDRFAVQVTMATVDKHLADLTAGALTLSIFATTFGPSL